MVEKEEGAEERRRVVELRMDSVSLAAAVGIAERSLEQRSRIEDLVVAVVAAERA